VEEGTFIRAMARVSAPSTPERFTGAGLHSTPERFKAVGLGAAPSGLPNALIADAIDTEHLFRLVADEIHTFTPLNVAKTFCKLASLSDSPWFPRWQVISADTRFRKLLSGTREIVDAIGIEGRELVTIVKGIAKMNNRIRLNIRDADVHATLLALDKRVPLVAHDMNVQDVTTLIWAYASMWFTPGDEAWTALQAGILRVAPKMNTHEVSLTVWACGKMGLMPDAQVWAAVQACVASFALDCDRFTADPRKRSPMETHHLSNIYLGYAKLEAVPNSRARMVMETTMIRLAPNMLGNQVATIFFACGTLRISPSDKALEAIEAALPMLVPRMIPQEIANTLWGYARLGLAPGETVWPLLEASVGRIAPIMSAQQVANISRAYSRIGGLVLGSKGRSPLSKTLHTLETVAKRLAPVMETQHVVNIICACPGLNVQPGREVEAALMRVAPALSCLHIATLTSAYSTMRLAPPLNVWLALDIAVARVGPHMNSQCLTNTIYAYASLDRLPMPEAWLAMQAASLRVMSSMTANQIATLVWSFATLAAVHTMRLPACYPVVWAAVRTIVGSSNDHLVLKMLFHAYLIQTELVTETISMPADLPEWIMDAPRQVWVASAGEARGKSTPKWVRQAVEILREFGVPHEVEHQTKDGYFSVDVYLPNKNVAVEFDGPTHFTREKHRTARTKIRDMFLDRRHRAVICVPYIAWETLEYWEKKQYLANVLQKACGLKPLKGSTAGLKGRQPLLEKGPHTQRSLSGAGCCV